MELSSEEISEGVLAIQIRVAGVCWDSLSSQDSDPLSELPVENIYQKNVLVNLEGVTMLNSSGVGWLLVCHKRFREAGNRMVLHSIPSLAMNVLKLMRLHEVFEIAKNEQEAMEAIADTETKV